MTVTMTLQLSRYKVGLCGFGLFSGAQNISVVTMSYTLPNLETHV